MKKIALILALIMVGCCVLCSCHSAKWSEEVLDKAERFSELYIETLIELQEDDYDVSYVSGNATEQTNSTHRIVYTGTAMVVVGDYEELYTATVQTILEYDESLDEFDVVNSTIGAFSSPIG